VPPLSPNNFVRKPLFDRAVGYLKFVAVFLVVAAVGILMGEQGMTQKQKLEEKMSLLQKENERLAGEIKSLERRVTLLRSDAKTIEKVAKRKLGMVRPDETVYILEQHDSSSPTARILEDGLAKDGNLP
jgi:cell division protein FtsB